MFDPEVPTARRILWNGRESQQVSLSVEVHRGGFWSGGGTLTSSPAPEEIPLGLGIMLQKLKTVEAIASTRSHRYIGLSNICQKENCCLMAGCRLLDGLR